MYTVSKNPSKIITKMRRSLVQNDEPFDSFKDIEQRKLFVKKPSRIFKTPKPVFHNINKKGQQMLPRAIQPVLNCINLSTQITPEHEMLIQFIEDSWQEIIDIESHANTKSHDTKKHAAGTKAAAKRDASNGLKCLRYNTCEGEHNEFLANFKPFDLESFWTQRIFNDIIKDS